MRIVLEAIGVSDYGIFSVVGGVIAMLGFITNALVITTQRYVSYYYGRHRTSQVKRFFTNSLFLHIILGLLIGLALLAIKGLLMNDFLKIDPDRLDAAKSVYDITVAILLVTVVTAPFKALFIAKENIVFISLIEMVDAILKLALAYLLLYIQADKLLLYVFILAGIQLLNLLAFALYANWQFPECSLLIRKRDISRIYIGQLLGFAGWTTYGMGAVAARNQGMAIILNICFSTTVNAAYGIANQVFGAISFLSTSILNAMNPQIMKAEGNKDRKKVFALAEKESKYSTMLLIIILVPLMFEMPSILNVWLTKVPDYCALFCNAILLSFICDQLTAGLNTINQAIGKIRTYTLLMYTPKLIYLPISYILFQNGGTIAEAMGHVRRYRTAGGLGAYSIHTLENPDEHEGFLPPCDSPTTAPGPFGLCHERRLPIAIPFQVPLPADGSTLRFRLLLGKLVHGPGSQRARIFQRANPQTNHW